MSGAAKTTKTKAKATVVPFVLAAVQNSPVQNPPVRNPTVQNPPVQNPPNTGNSPVAATAPAQETLEPVEIVAPPPAAKTPLSFEGIAILALGESGEILAARDACVVVFGWEAPALVGQNIRVLLKDGLDNEVGRFLHRHRAGKNPAGTVALRVWGVRKDGSEFPVQVTTLTWNWDTAVTTKGDISRLCWTAAFRDLGAAAKPSLQAAKDLRPSDEVESGKPGPAQPEPAATPQLIPPRPNSSQRNEDKNDQAVEQVATYELKLRIKELEDQLAKAALELAGTKAGAEKLGCHESELQVQLATAKEASGYTEAALREETARREKLEERLQTLSNSLKLEQAERSKRFEEELVSLRQERDELNSKLTSEQQGASESTRRAEELEASLSRNATELERAKAELEKQTAEREQSESSWRQQLDTVWIAKKEVEGAWAGAVERNKRFEEELASLRREHDELQSNLATEQKAAADAKERAKEVAGRLSRNAADSDRARAGLEKENEKRERVDAEWRAQLDAAKALKTRLETSLAEATERNKRIEEELAILRRERDELKNRAQSKKPTSGDSVHGELQHRLDQQTAELERLTADLEKESAEREQAEMRGREHQEAAKAQARKLEADWAAAVERNVCFEEELAELRRNRDELAIQLKAEQQAAADAEHRAGDLERRLERNTTELQRISAAAERQHSERETTDSEWHEQLETAKALAKKLDAAWTAATERSRRLEEDAVSLRQEREELKGKLVIAQREVGDSEARIKELESQVKRMAGHQNHERRTPMEPPRRDLHHQNGHSVPKRDVSSAKRAGLPSMGAVQPIQKAPEPERMQVESVQAASRHTGQVIQQYNFDNLTSKPARREASSPKKRHQP